MYNSLSTDKLLERLWSLASNLDKDLDDTFGNATYDINEIRLILEVLEDRVVDNDPVEE